jgi:acetyl esterase/lipase
MHGVFFDMIKSCPFPLAVGLVGFSSLAQTVPQAAPVQEKISLWSRRAPMGDGTFQEADATIAVHRPANPNGTAIIICPGGGYGGLVSGSEGHGIADWLNQHGIVGVVLEYRLPKGNSAVPLLDAQRAIRLVRSKAGEWGCDPKRIGIMGFSAGGHLASTAGTRFDAGNAMAEDPIEKMSCRPDFMVLIYPVISLGEKGHAGTRTNLLGQNPSGENIKLFSSELQVTAQTPPAFLAHAKDDHVVPPENSKMFYDALKRNKVAAEFVDLPQGGHGFNGYQGPTWDEWQEKALKWLDAMGFLKKLN